MSGTPGLNPRSGMISLDLPPGTIKPVPGGVDDHHVTVVYLGPDIDDAAFAKACQRARDAAAKMNGPLTGSVAGISSFPPSDSSDGKRPAFAPVRLPGAKLLRSRLEDLSASEHKNWVPHVTLAYIGKDDPLPSGVPPTPVTFTHLSVHRGEDVKRFPLGGSGSAHSGGAAGIELSAQTARLAITPAPAGKPGGPGLYHVKGMELPSYFQNVRNALIRDGHTPADAYRITWGAIRRWAHGGGKAHPEVVAAAQAALADLAAKSAIAHSHANEGGNTVALTWNGQSVDLASLELGSYIAPHLPAGTPQGGQFGTTSGGGATAGKTAGSAKAAAQARAAGLAKRAALHAQASQLRAQAQVIETQIAGISKVIAAQVKAAAAAAAKPKASATAKAKAAVAKAATKKAATTAKKTTATVKRPTLAQNRSQVTALHSRAHALWVQADALDAQANAVKLSGGDGGGMDFLELAVADAIAVPDPALRRQVLPPADRVPPGVREGGQYAAKAAVLTSHDTPEQAASVINGMGPRQRAAVRASTLPPPGFAWGPNDRLASAQ